VRQGKIDKNLVFPRDLLTRGSYQGIVVTPVCVPVVAGRPGRTLKTEYNENPGKGVTLGPRPWTNKGSRGEELPYIMILMYATSI
jgi:hypothetical protein